MEYNPSFHAIENASLMLITICLHIKGLGSYTVTLANSTNSVGLLLLSASFKIR